MTPWELPAGNFFLEEINKGCGDGCHMVIVLPATMLTEAVAAVEEHFYRQRMEARQIELAPGLTVLAAICEQMMLEPIQDWKQLLQTDLDTQFVLLTGFEALPESEQAEISQELSQAARFSHSGDAHWHFLLFVLPGDDVNLKTDLRLRIIPWWNRLGPVDIEYAFQKLVSSQAIENDVDFLWCYSLLHALRDPSLVFSIADTPPRAFEEVQAMLEEHPLFEEARKHSESISNYQQNNAIFYIYDKNGNTPVDKKTVPMWRHGFICENGSLHPVAMHAAKRTKDLKRCIAKGQIRVLLPIIQDVHAGLLAYLNNALPDGWLSQIETDDDKREAVRTEIGPLAFCIRKLCYDEMVVRKQVCDLAFAWRKIRNSLAHYEPIQYEKLKDALTLGEIFYGGKSCGGWAAKYSRQSLKEDVYPNIRSNSDLAQIVLVKRHNKPSAFSLEVSEGCSGGGRLFLGVFGWDSTLRNHLINTVGTMPSHIVDRDSNPLGGTNKTHEFA